MDTEGKRTCAEVSMIPEAALANAATNPPPGNYSGHGHGGRADHYGTPNHSHQGGRIGTEGKRTGAELSMFVCLFVCLLGNLFSSGFNPSCVFALYSIEGS